MDIIINAIFQNLIENGVKYNESKQIEINVSYQDKEDNHLFYSAKGSVKKIDVPLSSSDLIQIFPP